jgi:hypothetical protein
MKFAVKLGILVLLLSYITSVTFKGYKPIAYNNYQLFEHPPGDFVLNYQNDFLV